MLESLYLAHKRKEITKLTAVVIALLISPFALCVRGVRANLTSGPVSYPSRPITRLFLDPNGDRKPEKIDLLAGGSLRTIQIELETQRENLTFSVDNNREGFLIPYDIDRDSDLDLIWVVSADKKKSIVYINDGRANFRIQKDTARFASELNDLFPNDNPNDQQSLKLKRKDAGAKATPSSKIVFTSGHQLAFTEDWTTPASPVSVFNLRSPFLSYLRERGPPVSLS